MPKTLGIFKNDPKPISINNFSSGQILTQSIDIPFLAKAPPSCVCRLLLSSLAGRDDSFGCSGDAVRLLVSPLGAVYGLVCAALGRPWAFVGGLYVMLGFLLPFFWRAIEKSSFRGVPNPIFR